jgi:hypothetical protein
LVGSAKRLRYLPTTHLAVIISVFFFKFARCVGHKRTWPNLATGQRGK